MIDFDYTYLENITSHFKITGTVSQIDPIGNGHINDTFLVITETSAGIPEKYVLQRINHNIFHRPDLLMENMTSVTDFLQEKIKKRGGDIKKETLSIVRTNDSATYYQDENGNYWRTVYYVKDSICYDRVSDPALFYEIGITYGEFQRQLQDFPVRTLHETIPHFHNTKKRVTDLKLAIEKDTCNRCRLVTEEIRFFLERESYATILSEMQHKGDLPTRVTHNDTKVGNILLNKKTKKGMCVIDLDTVMPGLIAYDFGDAIRSGAATAIKTANGKTKTILNLSMYSSFKKGFLESCQDMLTKKEIETLPLGVNIMTYETALRYLTDYLEGDHYFKIRTPDQNLTRCRDLISLLTDMEKIN